jgi:hypothetical protein
MKLIEFLLLYKNNSNLEFIYNPEKYLLNEFFSVNTLNKEETLKYLQLISILKVSNIFLTLKQAKEENNEIHEVMSKLAILLMKHGLTPLTFSYFLSFVLYFFDYEITHIDWISPFSFSFKPSKNELNYKDFGFGTNIETLDEYDISDNGLHGSKSNDQMFYIPNTVTSISKNAFEGYLFNVVIIPSSVTTISQEAFKNCKNLEYVIFEDDFEIFSEGVFENCQNLKYLSNLPFIKSIGEYSLSKTAIEKIDEKQFKNSHIVSKLISQIISFKTLIINSTDALKSIKENSHIDTLILSESIRKLEPNSLLNITVDTLKLLSDRVDLEPGCFYNSSVKNIEFIDNRYLISDDFYLHFDEKLLLVLQNDLQEINLPNNITRICNGSINNLLSLKKLIIHSEIELVENYSILKCQSLKTIDFFGLDLNVFQENFTEKTQIESLILNQQIRNAIFNFFPKVKKVVLDENIEYIFPFQFANLEYLIQINLDKIKTIDDYAFHNCVSLQEVELTNVDFIGLGSYSHCFSLEKFLFKIPKNEISVVHPRTFGSIFDITKHSKCCEIHQETPIGRKTYYLPRSLTTIVVSSTEIPFGYFSGINSVKLLFSNRISYIDTYGLYQSSVKSFIVSNEVTVKEFGLSDLNELVSIENLENASTIEKNNFINCYSLEKLILNIDDFEIDETTLNSLKSLRELQIKTFKNKNWILHDNLLYDVENQTLVYAPPKYSPINLDLTRISVIHKNIFKTLKSVVNINISNANIIEDDAFENLVNLKKLSIDDQIHFIGKNILKNCHSLEELSIPFIGSEKQSSFEGDFLSYYTTTHLNNLKILEVREGYINKTLFNSLKSLNVFRYFGSDTKLNNRAFQNMKTLLEVHFEKGLNYIGDYCFALCENLVIDLEFYSLVSIGNGSFEKCHSIEEVILQDSIETIGENAFNDCVNISTINVSSKVLIGGNAFKTNSKIISLNLNLFDGDLKFIFGQNFSIRHATIISNNIKSNFMDKNTSIETISLLGNYESIPNNAFSYCTNLRRVSLSNTVSTIGENAFFMATRMKELSGLDSVEIVNAFAFSKCFDLKSLSLPKVKVIQENAFSDCESLFNITLSEQLEKIEPMAFTSCQNLKNIEAIENVIELGHSAFKMCTSLEEIHLPKITVIKENAFTECSSLKYFDVSSTCKIIEENAFKLCSSLKKVTIPLSVNYIDNFAFEGANTNLMIALTKRNQRKTYNSYWNYKSRSILNESKFFKKLKLWFNDKFEIITIK